MTSPDAVTGPIPAWTCGACDSVWWGASKRDVLDEGWKFHDARRGRLFVMCGECEERFHLRRRLASGLAEMAEPVGAPAAR